eukprot:9011363-Pyramimonas_sp.AAC.1
MLCAVAARLGAGGAEVQQRGEGHRAAGARSRTSPPERVRAAGARRAGEPLRGPDNGARALRGGHSPGPHGHQAVAGVW